MTKLVLIDSMAILYRAYFALPPMKTKSGEPVSAVYGLVSMLLRIIQDLKPTHIIACFDRKEPTFRVKEYKDYQSQRPPTPNDLVSQFEEAKVVLGAIGVPCYEMAGYEADDVIGTIAVKAIGLETTDYRYKLKKTVDSSQLAVDSVVIVTGDRDQLQLVNDKVKLYMPITGLSNAKMMGTAEVKEKMGVTPSQIVDYKALVGDASDNYFGVPGIGPKTAIKLLQRYVTVEQIYKSLNEIEPKLREKLIKDKVNADLSYKLATIVTDVPIEFNLDAAKKWTVDNNNVLSLFQDKYGFKTLTNRVKEVGKSITNENQMSLL